MILKHTFRLEVFYTNFECHSVFTSENWATDRFAIDFECVDFQSKSIPIWNNIAWSYFDWTSESMCSIELDSIELKFQHQLKEPDWKACVIVVELSHFVAQTVIKSFGDNFDRKWLKHKAIWIKIWIFPTIVPFWIRAWFKFTHLCTLHDCNNRRANSFCISFILLSWIVPNIRYPWRHNNVSSCYLFQNPIRLIESLAFCWRLFSILCIKLLFSTTISFYRSIIWWISFYFVLNSHHFYVIFIFICCWRIYC